MPVLGFSADKINREDAINQILYSIAMEELGLSHVINAEAGKLQYVLGALAGSSGSADAMDQVLRASEGMQKVLDTISNNQMHLRAKLSDTLNYAASLDKANADNAAGEPENEDSVGSPEPAVTAEPAIPTEP